MNPDKRQSIPCTFHFEKGGCRKGENCEYSHNQSDYDSQGPSPPRGGGHHGGGFAGRGFRRGGFGEGRGGFGGRPPYHENQEQNDPQNDMNGGGGRGGGRGGRGARRGFNSRPNPQSSGYTKPKPYPPKPPQDQFGGGGGQPGQCCKNFRQGNCSYGAKCRFKHWWTDNDDLGLVYLKPFGDEASKTDEFEIRDVCMLDIANKTVAFSQPQGILIVDLNNANNDFQTRAMAGSEELTSMKFLEQSLILGIFDYTKNCSLVRIIKQDGAEINIDPAHQDYIVDICTVREYIVTASLDEKIKLWRWEPNSAKFKVELTQQHKKISKIMYLAFNGFDSLFVANEDFSLSIYTLDTSGLSIVLNLVSNMENYHGGTISSLKAFNLNGKIHVVTASFDKTVKFFSMEEGKIVHQQAFELEISSMDIVLNNKDKDVLAIGCANGNVELYEINQNFLEVGKLIIHKPRLISNVVGFSEKKNDVSFNYMIVTDTGGRVSTWQFQREKK